MKLLIVDDELLVRIGLKSSVDWAKHGIEIAGEASNGREALEKIESVRPDVVLLDIKMPVIDGIEVLRTLKDKKHPCKTIILSSFDDLEHVKEAMKLGAIDYLHKPCMTPESILKVLLSVKSEIEKAKEAVNTDFLPHMEQKDDHNAESFLRKLLDGLISDDAQFYKGLCDFKLNLGRTNFSCIAFSVISYKRVLQRYTNNNRELLSKSVLDIVSQVFSNKPGIVFFQYAKNLFVGISSMEKIVSSKEVFDQQTRNVHIIQDALKKFLDVEVAAGISENHPSPENIPTAFIEAYKALQQRFYNPREKILFYGTLPKTQDNKGVLSKISQCVIKLKECIALKSHYQCKDRIEEIFTLLRESPFLSTEEVYKLFSGILFLLNELDTCFEEMTHISDCETLDELYEVFGKILSRNMLTCLDMDRYKNCSFLVKKILNYVNSNYDKDLTLSGLAEQMNVSPNYISRIFKDEVGKTLFNYINEVRVEHAKKLMHQQELKIYEIGEKVGFNSSVHFNIVFNKITGCSPKQYRDTLLG